MNDPEKQTPRRRGFVRFFSDTLRVARGVRADNEKREREYGDPTVVWVKGQLYKADTQDISVTKNAGQFDELALLNTAGATVRIIDTPDPVTNNAGRLYRVVSSELMQDGDIQRICRTVRLAYPGDEPDFIGKRPASEAFQRVNDNTIGTYIMLPADTRVIDFRPLGTNATEEVVEAANGAAQTLQEVLRVAFRDDKTAKR
jgi:hypothetical protein